MYKSKLIDTLKHFSTFELSQFHEFLKSPFFNKNTLVTQLFQIIYESSPTFSENKLLKEKIFPRLFGKESAFNVSKINSIMYMLMHRADAFLTITSFMNHELSYRHYFLSALNSHSINSRFDAEYEESKKYFAENFKSFPEVFLYHYLTESVRDRYLGLNNLGSNNENKANQLYFIDCFYLSSRLKESCKACIINLFVSKTFDFKIIQPLLEYVQCRADEFIGIPMVYIYYETMCLLQNPNKAKFKDLLDYINKNEDGIEERELVSLYENIIAYCHINERNSEDKKFHVFTGLSAYKRLMEINLLFKYDAHPEVTFMNVVNFSLGLKEYPFIEYFIKEYSEKLPEDKRGFVCSKAEASMCRIQKNYVRAIEVLSSLSSDNLYFQLDIKQSLLALYYLSGKADQFENFVHTFKVFVHRKKNKLPQEQYILFNNYIHFLNKIFHLKDKRKLLHSEEYMRLYNPIEQELKKSVALQKEWLIDQLMKLK